MAFELKVVLCIMLRAYLPGCAIINSIVKFEGYPHPASNVNNRLFYDFSTSLTKIEKQSILINK